MNSHKVSKKEKESYFTSAKLLRWAGSKTQSANQILPHLDFDKPYIEPFCGSASFLFMKHPQKSNLNDTNSALISFYGEVQKSPEDLHEIYNSIPISDTDYYATRDRFNILENSLEKAALFLYLNHFCFNGLYRTNLRGDFNTPFNKSDKKKRKLSRFQLQEFSNLIRNTHFHNKDFEEFLNRLNPVGACIYMDPPYFTKDNRVFGEYGKKVFKNDDLQRLCTVAKKFSKNNKIIITYKDCTEFRELFEKKISGIIPITRNVGGFSGRRKKDVEVLAVLGG